MRIINRRPTLQILAENVRHLMAQEAGMTQTKLASQIEASQKTISNVLNSAGWPTLKTVADIASRFRLPEWLLLADIRDQTLLKDRNYADAVELLANCDPDTREYLYSIIRREAERAPVPCERSTPSLPAQRPAQAHQVC